MTCMLSLALGRSWNGPLLIRQGQVPFVLPGRQPSKPLSSLLSSPCLGPQTCRRFHPDSRTSRTEIPLRPGVSSSASQVGCRDSLCQSSEMRPSHSYPWPRFLTASSQGMIQPTPSGKLVRFDAVDMGPAENEENKTPVDFVG